MATSTGVMTTETNTDVKQRRDDADADAAAAAAAPSGAKESVFPDINTIRNAIPPHCFRPSAAVSLGYMARDFALCFALVWAALTYIPGLPAGAARWAAWAVYGWLQGLVCTGIWILGHEGGHGAFSPYGWLNDVAGWTAHSFLLVPYFSWKFSHHRHHRFTGHMEKDTVFVPRTRDEHYRVRPSALWLDPHTLEDTPLVQAAQLVLHQLLGWQTYLLFNVSAGPASTQRKPGSLLRASHFEPTSAVFRPSEAAHVALSDLGLAVMGGLLYWASTAVGGATVALLYAVPYFWVHHWLVAITYLHHTHPDVHHYDADSWSYVKGALATIDRDFGFVGKHLFHGIIETHVVHHLFPRIPFYYQDEATDAIKPVLGPLYHCDRRPFLKQLWSVFRRCHYVESDPDVPGAMRWGKRDSA